VGREEWRERGATGGSENERHREDGGSRSPGV
jgi:hypothetical protein